MSFVRQAMKRALAAVLARDRFLVRGPARRDKTDAGAPVEIALTFDDGPHPVWTPRVLEELSRAGWKGAFFVIGERAAEHPALVRRIVDEGHAIGNHTFTHASPGETCAGRFLEEVRCTDELIADLTGASTTLVRPPLGRLNREKFAALWKSRRSIILWNVDPKDFAMQARKDAAAWAETYVPADGDVVLLHDRLPYAAEIVRCLSRRHGRRLRSVAVSDWLKESTVVDEGKSPEMTLSARD